ncbi:MAG: TlpA family protein disulfide reductase [Chitinophagaceae bacterium]
MKLTSLYFLIFSCAIFYFPAFGQNEKGKVLIHGTIRNYRNVIEVMDNDYSQPFQITNPERSFVPDSQGRFSIEFTLNEPKYFRLARNSIYLCPGDKLEVDIDYDDARNSTFRGSRKQENEYLKFIPYPKAGSFLEGGQNVKSTIEQTINALLDSAKQRRNNLANFKNLSSEFRFLEQNRIDADLINSFYGLRWYYPYVHKLKGDSLTSFHNNFFNVIDSFAKKYVPTTLDAKLMKLEVYRDVVHRILKLKDSDSVGKDAAIINDWFYAKQILHEMQTDTIGFDVPKIASIKTPEYRNEVLKTYEKLLNLKGTNAIDIVLTDSRGKTIDLSSLKGKIIYIDVWATWCIPCIKELPYLDSLKERYKNNSDIAFLSLSIDSNESDWLDFLKKNHLTGLQYNTDFSTLAPYYVSEIPRTILIDKNFHIYAMRGPMPSSSEAINILEKMLQQQ